MKLIEQILFPAVSYKKNEIEKHLSNKTIVITGASFGIGEAFCKIIATYNVTLFLIARSEDKLNLLKKEWKTPNNHIEIMVADLNNTEDVKKLVQKLQDIPIHFFINNAGKSIMRSVEDSKERMHDFERTNRINYLSPVQLILGLYDNFKVNKTRIINTSTYNVLMPVPPKWSAYLASKIALHTWLKSNEPEMKLHGITICNLYYPLVHTRMIAPNPKYKNAIAMPVETAAAIMVKKLLKNSNHFKPWWHFLVLIVLVPIKPFWKIIWYYLLKNQKY